MSYALQTTVSKSIKKLQATFVLRVYRKTGITCAFQYFLGRKQSRTGDAEKTSQVSFPSLAVATFTQVPILIILTIPLSKECCTSTKRVYNTPLRKKQCKK